MKLEVAVLECENAGLGGCETWEKLICFLLKLRICGKREDEGGEGKKSGKGRTWEIDRNCDDEIH